MINLLFNRYTIGIASVALFVVPWVQAHVAILNNVAETLSKIAG